MGYLSERVSYLRGLADGMKLNEDTNEGRLLKEIIEVLDDIALAVEEVEEDHEEIRETLDDMDERMDDMESDLYDDEDGEITYEDLRCPNCDAVIAVDDDVLNDECTQITCPSCGEVIDIDWDCDCGDCDCGCGHHEDDKD